LAYLLHYPEWQGKIHSEMSALTGNNSKRVALNEKEQAHLTNAFIEEVTKNIATNLKTSLTRILL